MGEGFKLHRASGIAGPGFSYTGNYEFIDEGHGNWRIKLLTSGTFVFSRLGTARKGIDVFLVGGGAKGFYDGSSPVLLVVCGGSGYTNTVRNVSVSKETSYPVVIGSGGAGNQEATASSGFGASANPGNKGTVTTTTTPDGTIYLGNGGNGGSGGGGEDYFVLPAGRHATGGQDGADSSDYEEQSYVYRIAGGTGQHTTTREFGEAGGDLYAMGGGANTPITPNSGNGGYRNEGASGIVVIRNAR